MNPLDFLNVADRLKNATDEADLRTSISRSYYATYNFLLQSLSLHSVHFEKTGDDHARLGYYLASSKDPRTMKLAGKLRRLRVSRGEADYNLVAVKNASDSQLAFSTANAVIRDFGSIPLSDLTGIITTIRSLPPFSPPWKAGTSGSPP